MDEAALKVLKAAEETKQVLQQKEEVLSGIRTEFERKSKEVNEPHRLSRPGVSVLLQYPKALLLPLCMCAS